MTTKIKMSVIRLESCFQLPTLDTNATRRALSNGIIRFPIAPTMSLKNQKYQYFTLGILEPIY